MPRGTAVLRRLGAPTVDLALQQSTWRPTGLTNITCRSMLKAMTEETAKILCDYILPQLRHEFATTKKVLSAVPADQCGYRPSEKCMTGLELAGHIALA